MNQSIAPSTGPFGTEAFLATWWRLEPGGERITAETESARVELWLDGHLLRMAGESDLTDYHTLWGDGAGDALSNAVGQLSPGTRVELDSFPQEAASVAVEALRRAGLEPEVRAHESTAVLRLEGDVEDWLGTLSSKQRHEVRRKRRRYEESLGDPKLMRFGAAELDRFFVMHRMSPGDKGEFMTPKMERFFRDLLESVPGSRLDGLVTSDGTISAAAFGFEDADGYYLYNSAFDRDLTEQSPGIVLLNELIGDVANSGLGQFDFLKGDEQYKYRLGAESRKLYVVEATT